MLSLRLVEKRMAFPSKFPLIKQKTDDHEDQSAKNHEKQNDCNCGISHSNSLASILHPSAAMG